MTRYPLTAMAMCMLLIGSASSQESKTKDIDWIKVRDSFAAYCQLRSVENAERVLAAMSDGFGYKEGDAREFAATVRYIFNGRPFKVLNKLVRKGDPYALRIAFRILLIFTNLEDKACILIGKSIRADPILFLEEFKASGLERVWLDLIVTSYGWEDEGYPELSDKEVRLRLRSLQSVDRPDLIELRDICTTRLKKEQEYRRKRNGLTPE